METAYPVGRLATLLFFLYSSVIPQSRAMSKTAGDYKDVQKDNGENIFIKYKYWHFPTIALLHIFHTQVQ
jgi:hypothetical protein